MLVALLAAAAAYAAVKLTRDEAPAAPGRGQARAAERRRARRRHRRRRPRRLRHRRPSRDRPEVTRGSDGEVWVRYLSGGAKVGDPRADYLTIGTYPRADALAAAKAAAEGEQQRSAELPDGGVMLWSLERPESVYAASPGSDLLVEVYLDPERACALVGDGAVAPLR